MALEFAIRVVQPNGRVRVLSRTDLAASIKAAGYVPEVGLKQLEFAIQRALDHVDAPAPASNVIHLPPPDDTPGAA